MRSEFPAVRRVNSDAPHPWFASAGCANVTASVASSTNTSLSRDGRAVLAAGEAARLDGLGGPKAERVALAAAISTSMVNLIYR